MAYIPDLHQCYVCERDLGSDDGDGVCPAHDLTMDDVEAFFCDYPKHWLRYLGEGRWQCWIIVDRPAPLKVIHPTGRSAETAMVLAVAEAIQAGAEWEPGY
jgi:hypothetical protein